MAIRVCITSTLHQGYYRAGLAIAPGKSELVVSAEQCAALAADPRLVVVRLAEDPEPASADAPQADGDLDAAVGGLTADTEAPEAPAQTAPHQEVSGKGKGK